MLRFKSLLLAAAMIVGPAPVTAGPDSALFEDIRAIDSDLARIGERLAVANAALCDRQKPGLGLLLHTPEQYAPETREAAIRHFQIDGPVGVEAVLENSPAAMAGLRAGDTLLGIGAIRFAPPRRDAKASTAALIKVEKQIAELPADRPLRLYVRRNGSDKNVTVEPKPSCRTRFELAVGPEFAAQADGEMVQIGSRFFAEYPDLVPAPIAHELAHNMLRHRERLEASGVSFGLLSGFGRNVRYFRQTELEADILSVSLLANAGYDPAIALRFWSRFGPSQDMGPLGSRSHPAWRDRVATMERAIAGLGAARPHRPAILDTRDRPLDGDWQSLLVKAQ